MGVCLGWFKKYKEVREEGVEGLLGKVLGYAVRGGREGGSRFYRETGVFGAFLVEDGLIFFMFYKGCFCCCVEIDCVG